MFPRTIYRAIESIKKKSRLYRLAYYDSLTGLYNRNYLLGKLDVVKKIYNPSHLYFVDANNLHEVNRKFGFEVGDKYLISVAKDVKSKFSPHSIVVRYGGDEFIVLTNDIFNGKILGASIGKSLLGDDIKKSIAVADRDCIINKKFRRYYG